MQKTSSTAAGRTIAKITGPRLSKIFPRKRLFRLLDRSHDRPVTWVSGPGGSGKTTLVSSYLDARKLPCLWYQVDERDSDIATFFYYMGLAAKKASPRTRTPMPLLTAEYLSGISTFTRRYFENLYSRLKPPFTIVLDNYQEVNADSPFHEVIQNGLSNIPHGINVIVMSRSDPLPALSRLRAGNSMEVIGWDELRLTPDESEGILRLQEMSRLSKEAIRQIHEEAHGWAAGLVLLTERAKALGGEGLLPGRPSRAGIFDYFAEEIFNKLDSTSRDFLLMTSILPKMTVSASEKFTGQANSGRILSRLSRNHFFTEKHAAPEPVYQYHPLFREFLLTRMKESLSKEGLLGLQRRAGALLEGSGQVEDAAELYRASGEWESFARLVLTNAKSMVSQGRNRVLEEWLKSLPAEVLDHDPWLLYWLGMCRMPFAPLESRRCFEKSFSLFRKRRDPAGVFLAWSGAVESIIQELGDLRQMDPWIALLDDLLNEYSNFPSPQIEGHVTSRIFMALSLRQPWHPAFNAWKEKAMKLLENSGAEASLRLLTGYYLFTHFVQAGDRAACEHVLGVINRIAESHKNVSPLALGMAKMADAWLAWATCSYERCMAVMNEGLEISGESGVHLWDYLHRTMGVCASLSSGDPEQSAKLLGQMSSAVEKGRPLDKFYYYHMMSCHCSHAGDIPGALSLENSALDLAKKIGFLGAQVRSRINMAHLMRETGKHGEAREHIAECRRIGRKVKSDLIEFFCLVSEACTAFAEDDEAAGMRSLRDAMTLGRKKGFAAFNYAAWFPKELFSLCLKALEAGIETGFVRDMIRRRNLVPEEPPLHIENWPWPVKIYTLGGFRLLVDDKPVASGGKAQKKPLEMLKALVALGGSDIRESQLTDALWPEAEGDAASTAFRTTLHRLRRLVGSETVVAVRDGRVSLDPRYCWTDVWAFERNMEQADRVGVRDGNAVASVQNKSAIRNQQSAMAHLERALALYRGHFLQTDEDKLWATSLRERLRSKFLRVVNTLGDYWLENGEGGKEKAGIRKAVEFYEKGLEIDDVAEEFYQGLMFCHHRLGRKAEIMKVYKRCRDTLSATLGVEPSEETEQFFRKLKGK